MKRTFTIALAAAATFAAASPAYSATNLFPVNPDTPCSVASIFPNADSCTGWWKGNLNGQSAGVYDAVLEALQNLDPTITSFTSLEYLSSISGSEIDFSTLLSGKTIIGVHRGGAGDFRPDGTSFYLWNNLSETDKLTISFKGLSNATLYMTGGGAVPEPATWALMIAGIGLAGWQLRRRRQTVKVTYA